MTTLDRTTSPVRRTARGITALSVPGLALVAVPAHADIPEGWSDPAPVDMLEALLVLAGIPLLLFALIAVAVYLPSMVRGERLLPDHGPGHAEWLGGPHEQAAELPAPDDGESRAGGASGSW